MMKHQCKIRHAGGEKTDHDEDELEVEEDSNVAQLGIHLAMTKKPFPSDHPYNPKKKPHPKIIPLTDMYPKKADYGNPDKNAKDNKQGTYCS